MQISFRQGILHAPTTFLTYNLNGHIDLVIPTNNILTYTIADQNSNYLFTEKTTVLNAWVGPFVSSLTYWLYWDIDVNSGVRTFGATLHQPILSATTPSTPNNDQHWYNTTRNEMFVWNGARWVKKLRLFASRMTNNSTFISVSAETPAFTGTQIGIGIPGSPSINRAGYLVYDNTSAHPIKKFDGTFFTTEDRVLTGISSTSEVKFGSILVEGIASTPLSAYSVVRFSDFHIISQATNYLVDNGAYGIIEVDAVTGESVNVVMEGLITNPAWNWNSVAVNTPLYVNNLGQLTTTPPATPIIIATVIDSQTILLRPSSLFVNTQNDPASSTNMGSVYLSTNPDVPSAPTAVSINDVNYLSTIAHLSDTTSHLTLDQHNLISGLITPNNNVALQVGTISAKSYHHNVVTLVDASGISWDMVNGTLASITLTASTTMHAPTNMPIGTVIILTIIQDSVGLHNVTFDPVFKWASGSAPNFGTSAGTSRSILTFISDGTYLYEVSRSINVI